MDAWVLVIEDNVEVAASLKTHLALEGYQAWITTTNGAALARLRHEVQPRAILFDTDSKALDYPSFVRALMQSREHAWIPVILLSASPKASAFAKATGEYAQVRKPFVMDDLLEILGRAVRLQSSHRRPKGGSGE